MIFSNHYHTQVPICMKMKPVSSVNMRTLKIENVLNKDFSSLCHWLIDNKLSIYFGEDKTKSILFSKTRGLKEINISFVGHSIKQHKTAEYPGCQLDSKLSGEAVASKFLKNKCQTKISVSPKQVPNPCVQNTIM